MDFEHGTDKSSEAQESIININNVVLSYVVEMNEHRSRLYSASQGMAGVTPAPFREFINAFYKLFTLTHSMLPEALQKEIFRYFDDNPKSNDPKGKKGINISMKMQTELENQRMITLYEETIVPPFVETEEEEEKLSLSQKKVIPVASRPPAKLPIRRK